MITLDENATAIEPSASHRYQYTRQPAAAPPPGGAQAVGAAPGQHIDASEAPAGGPPGLQQRPGGGFGGQAIGGIPRSAIPGLGGAAGGYQPAAIPGLGASSGLPAGPGGAPAPAAAAAAAVAAPSMARPGMRPQQQRAGAPAGRLGRPWCGVAAGTCYCEPWRAVCATAVDRGCAGAPLEPCLQQTQLPLLPPADFTADPVFPSEWKPGLPIKLPGQASRPRGWLAAEGRRCLHACCLHALLQGPPGAAAVFAALRAPAACCFKPLHQPLCCSVCSLPLPPPLNPTPQLLTLPVQTRVSPEEYREFLALGHGEIFNLDLDSVVDAPWR